MEELFRNINIEGFEKYYLTTKDGGIYSIRKGEFMLGKLDKGGYRVFHLRAPGLNKHVKGHRIVALTYIENPNNYAQVNHINGVKDDNRMENLEWCDSRMNQIHSYQVLKNKHWAEGIKRADPSVGIPIEEIDNFGNFIQAFKSIAEASRELGISKSGIQNCVKGVINTTFGKRFRYTN